MATFETFSEESSSGRLFYWRLLTACDGGDVVACSRGFASRADAAAEAWALRRLAGRATIDDRGDETPFPELSAGRFRRVPDVASLRVSTPGELRRHQHRHGRHGRDEHGWDEHGWDEHGRGEHGCDEHGRDEHRPEAHHPEPHEPDEDRHAGRGASRSEPQRATEGGSGYGPDDGHERRTVDPTEHVPGRRRGAKAEPETEREKEPDLQPAAGGTKKAPARAAKRPVQARTTPQRQRRRAAKGG